MDRKFDRKMRYKKPYESLQNQNFLRKDNCEDYYGVAFGKYRPTNQYRNYKGRGRESSNHFKIFNLKSLNKREVQNFSNNGNIKSCPWSEEAAEEERKRRVSDTANELKNKLKMWNTVKDQKLQVGESRCSERTHNGLCKDNKVLPVTTSENKDIELTSMGNESRAQELSQSHAQENDMDDKNFHLSGQEMSHKKLTNSGILLKSNSLKPHTLSSISRNRQKKIQQSLIGELMAIPKANLKKVLVNPQTHPKIEQKMAQIVKENRLILAQKFRSLAESKISQQGQFVCSKFVDDVGDFIDPDLAVDLCQLPPELISQISDIFQLDFDGNLKVFEDQEKLKSNKNMNKDCIVEMALSCDENSDLNDSNIEDGIFQYKAKEMPDTKVEPQIINGEECNDFLKDKLINDWHSSSENFHNTFNVECIKTNSHLSSSQSSCKVFGEESKSANNFGNKPVDSEVFITSKCFLKSCETLSNHSNNSSIPDKLPYIVDECSYLENKIKTEPKETEGPNDVENNSFHTFFEMNVVGSTSAEEYPNKSQDKVSKLKKDIKEPKLFSIKTSAVKKKVRDKLGNNIQNIKNIFNGIENPGYKSTETQTDINLMEADHSQPLLGQLYSGDTEKSLLREVQMIDDLLHKLNQRRFIIFLKLVGLESCNLYKNNLKTSLLEAITNSDAKLLKELSLKGNKKGVTKRNIKRKKNPDRLKNVSKKANAVRTIDDADMVNEELGVNIQDPTQNSRKFGGKAMRDVPDCDS